MTNLNHCHQCGQMMDTDAAGVSRHVHPDGTTDYEKDADHTPFPTIQNRAATVTPPDRDTWAETHGGAPVKLEADQRLVDQAVKHAWRDETTSDTAAAEKAQIRLESLCEQALFNSGIDNPDAHTCYFDAVEEAFWAYPL